jgi:hypothetical protein
VRFNDVLLKKRQSYEVELHGHVGVFMQFEMADMCTNDGEANPARNHVSPNKAHVGYLCCKCEHCLLDL